MARVVEHRAPPPKRFSRQWFLDQAGTIVWTVVITMLVWVYADIHFTQKRQIALTLKVENGARDELAILQPRPPKLPIRAEIRGRRSALDRLERESTLTFDVAKKLRAPGEYRKETTELLQTLPEIRQAGEVLSSQPDTLVFQIDTVEKVPDVKVRLELPGVQPESVKLQPERVTLYVPSSRAQEVVSESLVISATVTGSLPEGRPVTRQVTLTEPTAGSHLDPPEVTATFTIPLGQQIREREFLVPIRVQSPKQWLLDGTWSQYQFEEQPPPQSTARVTISGPQIELDRLRPEDIDVFLALTDAHKKPVGSWLPGPLRVEFRKDRDIDVGALKVIGPLPEIQFRLVKRTTPPAP
ncbi:MAG TPA: hypothetical protein VM389_02710 [Phycisphaerae bacterium]|nr:hypothetical protein [Phycisphaerae bacterium]